MAIHDPTPSNYSIDLLCDHIRAIELRNELRTTRGRGTPEDSVVLLAGQKGSKIVGKSDARRGGDKDKARHRARGRGRTLPAGSVGREVTTSAIAVPREARGKEGRTVQEDRMRTVPSLHPQAILHPQSLRVVRPRVSRSARWSIPLLLTAWRDTLSIRGVESLHQRSRRSTRLCPIRSSPYYHYTRERYDPRARMAPEHSSSPPYRMAKRLPGNFKASTTYLKSILVSFPSAPRVWSLV